MKTLLAILLFTASLSTTQARAGELEFYGGANSTTYDDVSDANTWGVTLRLQYNFSHADSGWILNLNAPGLGLFASELSAGYEWRTSGDFYVEGGLGGGYSLIRGPFPLVIAGIGYRLSPTVFVDLPITLTTAVTCLPYIGVTF